MSETRRMTALQLRKKALLLESDLNRLTLRAECERLLGAAGYVQELRRRIKPWALVLAPLAGVALALGLRHSRKIFFQMAEVAVPRELFQTILERIGRLKLATAMSG